MEQDDFQALWQQQAAPEYLTEQVAIQQVEDRFRQLQRQTIFTALGLSLCFALVFVGMGWLWNYLPIRGWLAQLGLGVMYLDMGGLLAIIWGRMVLYPNQQMLQNSQVYLQKFLGKLRWQDRMIRRVIPVYLGLLILGLNLLYFDILSELEDLLRMGIHLVVSLLCGLVYFLARPIHQRRVNEKVLPLIEEIQAIQASWT